MLWQNTPGQIGIRRSGTSAGTKSSEKGESITFADVAGVDEAKEELEEIVVSWTLFISFSALKIFRVRMRLSFLQ
jgi:ATP-dependent Zn protease